jgi:UDP-glucose 4-epimerase
LTNSTVLVTGGAGYIGSHAALALLAVGRAVAVADNLSTGFRQAVPPGVAFHEGDIADAAFVRAILADHQVGAVMHFAGSLSVAESVADPSKYYGNNTCASLSLAGTCIEAGVNHFIFSSSAAVYGTPDHSPVAEDSPTAPVSPYGASKVMTETMLTDLARAHPKFRPVCLRYFNVAGADPAGRSGQRGEEQVHLIPLGIETALGLHPELLIFGDDYPTRDGTCERDYVHVSDLAQAHVAALDYLEAGGEGAIMNCGYGRGYTVLEVIAAMEAVFGRELPKRRTARRPGDAVSAVSDVSLLKATLDWTPRYESLETIIRTALDWHASLAGQPRPGAGSASRIGSSGP